MSFLVAQIGHPPFIDLPIRRSLPSRGSGAFLRVLTAAVLLFVLVSGAAAGELAGRARIIDGDTLEIGGVRVRLAGIDAPELDQVCRGGRGEFPCGVLAAAWLSERTGEAVVVCTGDRQDRYGRRLAVCRAGDVDLNAGLVRAGWAIAFRRYSVAYVPEEADARRAGAGMWSGAFVRPAEWRRAKSDARPTRVADADCVIKGNVNSRGQRIYHRPGGQFHARLRLKPTEGDRCFETEQEAVAAGFRAAAR